MCFDCGCEAEPVIATLMEDHAAIAARVHRILQVLDAGRNDGVARLTAELAELCAHHAAVEESGLFAELRRVERIPGELHRLLAEHHHLLRGLSDVETVAQPDRLRALLDDLLRHTETEDRDLFPFALQSLPTDRWGAIEAVHQQLLTT